MDLDHLSHEQFSRHLGDVFEVDLGTSGTVGLELVESAPAGGDRCPEGSFSLVFKGPPGPGLPQATYPLRHATLGIHPIFLVPVGHGDDGFLYEAVFTRMP